MKKLMFSALVCVAFAFSGFASNEEVKGEKTKINEQENIQVSEEKNFAEACYITITTTRKDGTTRTQEYYVSSSPFKTCEEAVADLNKKFKEAQEKQSNTISKS
ncbi:hypothetical protein EG240_05435 [Paenimyroides tangerinum]|uniref:Uncharacterized protein n=1 Tax=Paenimyroides tangerinum TaxID=2488728 RepID=A0A3P3WGI1_9FLAO|nr:hypothetical protein [Paenimyroides tangerinum]RRJ91643.1 hypothetical protein EG240_05435 [Paenimyroides tangerinum]